MTRVNIITEALLFSLIALVLWNCELGEDFDDDKQSLVKKPEIISIVLDPPEAAPGDTVSASFLLVDEKGAMAPQLQFWFLVPPDAGSFASGAVDEGRMDAGGEEDTGGDVEGETMDFDSETMGFFPSFTFTVPGADHYSFNTNDMAPQLLTLLVAVEEMDFDPNAPETLPDDMNEIFADERFRSALRTLVVSTREKKNRNPRIAGLFARIGRGGRKREVTFVASHHDDIPAGRRLAAADPIVYEVCNREENFIEPDEYCGACEIYFTIEPEDDGNINEEIRPQWISNGGDFAGHRDLDQKFFPPCYKTNAPEPKKDEDGRVIHDPRANNPNLYTIWLILRDNGGDNQLGQSWAEFYLLIRLKDC